jgi:hypothetical protein
VEQRDTLAQRLVGAAFAILDLVSVDFGDRLCYDRPVGIMRQYERGPDGTWHDGLLMDLLPEGLEGDGGQR